MFCFSVLCFEPVFEIFCCLGCGDGIGLVCFVGFLFLLVLSCLVLVGSVSPKSKFKNQVGKNFGVMVFGFCGDIGFW